VRLQRTSGGLHWEIEQVPLTADAPSDPKFAALVQATFSKYLTADETAVVGKLPRALGPADAAKFAVAAARTAARADVALISGTTFGGGLPAGDVPRFAFDACVRFDGPLFVAEIDGARLKRILAHANQGPETPFLERAGENLVAVAPAEIEADRQYRFVTTDWVARNAKTYFGDDAPALAEAPGLKLKAAVLAALQKP
jgi:5'-nucleotidase / UDP-sugar diphosphatase